MPTYRLRYTVETRIQHHEDVSFRVQGHEAVFLFSRDPKDGDSVDVQIEVEADNARSAEARASCNLLPPVLDALSFAAGAPLILSECNLVLKREAGVRRRRALYVSIERTSPAAFVTGTQIGEAQAILDREGGPTLSLLWHRYALHRQYVLERFLFQWLSFESLAGTIEVRLACPECGHIRTHAGTNRIRAYEIFSACHRNVSVRDFNRDIWGRARNAVFHGVAYPDSEFLGRLVGLGNELRVACRDSLAQRYGLPREHRIDRGQEVSWRRFVFVEWETANPETHYADDFPEASVAALVSGGDQHQPGQGAAPQPEFSLLDVQSEYPGW